VICCASRREGETGYPDVPFRGERTSRRRTSGRYGPGSSYGSVIKVMVDEAGAAVEKCIDEWAQAAESSATKLEGGYEADDLAQEMSEWWGRMAREGARLVDVGVRAVQADPESGDPQDGEHETPVQTKAEETEL
jgi:hypothetical protein